MINAPIPARKNRFMGARSDSPDDQSAEFDNGVRSDV